METVSTMSAMSVTKLLCLSTCVANAIQMRSGQNYPAEWGKVLFLLPNKNSYLSQSDVGASLFDVVVGYEKFRNRGYTVEFVTLEGGDAPLDAAEVEDCKATENADLCSTFIQDHAQNGAIADTMKLEETDHLEYNAIYVPGGLPVVTEFSDSETVKNVMHTMYEGCRLVVTVSTGGLALLNTNISNGSYLVNGLPVSATTNAELKSANVYGSVKSNPCTPEDGLSKNGAVFQHEFAVAHNLGTAQNYSCLDGLFNAIDKAMKKNVFPNNCVNMGSVSGESVVVNFTTSKVTQNNLGDHGPETGIATLGFKSVSETQDGTMVNMRITSDDYSSTHSEENGLWGNITLFGNVNFDQDKTVSLKFGFWTAPPNSQPVIVNSFYLSFYDVTLHTSKSEGQYSVATSDHEAYFLDHGSTVSTQGSSDDVAILTGTEEGKEPWLSSRLSSEERRQAVTFLFANKSEVNFNISVWGGTASRNVRFTGRSIFRNH